MRLPDATCLDTRRLEEICLDACRLEEICLDTLRLEGICPDTRRLEGTCRGVRRPDATYLDTHRLEEICHDTRHLEGKMPWHLSLGRKYALALIVRKAHAVACVVRTPHAVRLVDRKKRRRFDNRRPEGYCGAHHRLVRIRTTGTRWERHVHWQAQSGSICGGTRRWICLPAKCPEGKCPNTRRLQEISLDTLRLEGKMPCHSSSGKHMPWHSSSGKHMPWLVSSGRQIH